MAIEKKLKGAKLKEVVYFGKELKISPKSKAIVSEGGVSIEFIDPSVEILIGIGKDYSAHLIMSEDAWKEFKKLKKEEIHIETIKDFKGKIK